MSIRDLIETDQKSPESQIDMFVDSDEYIRGKAMVRRWRKNDPDLCFVGVVKKGEKHMVSMKPDQLRAFGLACILAANLPSPDEG